MKIEKLTLENFSSFFKEKNIIGIGNLAEFTVKTKRGVNKIILNRMLLSSKLSTTKSFTNRNMNDIKGFLYLLNSTGWYHTDNKKYSNVNETSDICLFYKIGIYLPKFQVKHVSRRYL